MESGGNLHLKIWTNDIALSCGSASDECARLRLQDGHLAADRLALLQSVLMYTVAQTNLV
jgi:hypothetical protein